MLAEFAYTIAMAKPPSKSDDQTPTTPITEAGKPFGQPVPFKFSLPEGVTGRVVGGVPIGIRLVVNGKVARVSGSVVDVTYPGQLPSPIASFETQVNGTRLILEVIQYIDKNTIRTIAKGPTDGLMLDETVIVVENRLRNLDDQVESINLSKSNELDKFLDSRKDLYDSGKIDSTNADQIEKSRDSSAVEEAALLKQAIDTALKEAGVSHIDSLNLSENIASKLSQEGFGLTRHDGSLAQQAPDLPTEAPEKYQGLRGPETPPEFVRRVYGEWLGQGLTRGHIRNLDLTLYQAIVNWSRKPGNEWPADVDLPTVKEQNDRWIDRVQQDGGESLTQREARRLEGAIQRRRHSGKD